MDEQDKINEQLTALDAAEAALSSEDPLSPYVHDQIERLISSLQLRLLAVATSVVITPLSPAETAGLQSALTSLDTAVRQSAGAAQILQVATTLAST
jgi:hypothetical protein